MLAVGKVLKAHGIAGNVKVESFMDSPDCFIKIKEFFIDNVPYAVEKISKAGNFLLVKFKGINNMDVAEALRNKTLFCDALNLPIPKKGRFYIADLIGCTVTDGEKEYGQIKEILQNGSADVIVAVCKSQKIMFPWIKALNACVDTEAKVFLVDKQKLSEVILYEN